MVGITLPGGMQTDLSDAAEGLRPAPRAGLPEGSAPSRVWIEPIVLAMNQVPGATPPSQTLAESSALAVFAGTRRCAFQCMRTLLPVGMK